MIEILRTDSNNDCFITITKQLDNELYARYGSFQSKYDGYNSVGSLDTVVIGLIDNIPAGCGCFKSFDRKTAEIKRMMVLPEFRGSGLATIILVELEKWAAEKGFSSALLQTGIRQPDAIRFYTRNGYSIIDNYGQYAGDDNSVCMKKEISLNNK